MQLHCSWDTVHHTLFWAQPFPPHHTSNILSLSPEVQDQKHFHLSFPCIHRSRVQLAPKAPRVRHCQLCWGKGAKACKIKSLGQAKLASNTLCIHSAYYGKQAFNFNKTAFSFWIENWHILLNFFCACITNELREESILAISPHKSDLISTLLFCTILPDSQLRNPVIDKIILQITLYSLIL